MSAAACVDVPMDVVPPHAAGTVNIAALATEGEDNDLYARLKTLQRELEFLEIQVKRRFISQVFQLRTPGLLARPSRVLFRLRLRPPSLDLGGASVNSSALKKPIYG